ncbi:coiled-coil domain-containing protein 33 isoform X2 [Nematostella vectensis]|uniref:coiled-coil domain-containing protein 33 isoform X2 n=1 Tax=Nematostella vectensis TaxID=45351 RepID=UPI00207765AC|nr:coiled-coil domain-containing protein 33 isoform X2 [Nematostella vectensis]
MIARMPEEHPPALLKLNLSHVYFNSPGRYFLKISINGSVQKQYGVLLYVGSAKSPVHDHVYTTEPLEASSPDEPVFFKDSALSFHLPQGFASDDIILTVEAHQLGDDPGQAGSLYGKGSLTVYPHVMSLFPPNISTLDTPDKSQVIYSLAQQLILVKKLADNGVHVNVGVMKMEVTLKSLDKQPVKQPEKANATPNEPVAGPSTASQPVPVLTTPPVTPNGYDTRKTIPDPPLGSLSSPVHPRYLCGSFLAREGYCEVVVLVHAAYGIPAKSDGRLPQPYVTGSSRKDLSRKLPAQSVTHSSIQPTQSPAWGELLLIEVAKEDARQEEIILTVADHPSRELLTEFSIPIIHLKPTHQYHLELVKPMSESAKDTRLFVTLIVKEDALLEQGGSSDQILGLEMLLRGLESPISNQLGPLIAVARIAPDWQQYKDTMLTAQPSPAGVTMTTINFPSPHPMSFSVAGSAHAYGSPQVTVCGEPQEQPQWNQMLFFPGAQTSLFSSSASLVIEYYAISLATGASDWQLSSPLGYSYHRLDQFLLSSLQQESASLGLRLDSLPVEGLLIRTTMGTGATVGLVLRLVTAQRQDTRVAASHLSSLPVFRMAGPGPGPAPSNPAPIADQDPYGLPSFNAVKSVLPQFTAVPLRSRPPQAQMTAPRGDISATTAEMRSLRDLPPDLRNTMDMRTLALLDYQMQEVDRYRAAMRKLAADLLHLRQENARLEEANSRLRRDLNQHDEISRLMIGSDDLDNVTHGELVQKFALLKKKLSDESTRRQELQQRTQNLQNELIKKNEKEKELIKLQEAHESQQILLQKLQSKVQKYKTLQETCKKQEKVIVQLENLLSKESKGGYSKDSSGHLSQTLIDENTRLREELVRHKGLLKEAESKQASTRESTLLLSGAGMGDEERLGLLHKLEKAEGRILGLEKQMTESARKWAKEKADLQMRLNELTLSQQTGYKNSFSAFDVRQITDSPTMPSTKRPAYASRRPSPKLDPIGRR